VFEYGFLILLRVLQKSFIRNRLVYVGSDSSTKITTRTDSAFTVTSLALPIAVLASLALSCLLLTFLALLLLAASGAYGIGDCLSVCMSLCVSVCVVNFFKLLLLHFSDSHETWHT